MPNWCDNRVELTHRNKQLIDRAEKAFKEEKFLQEFIPVPKELLDTPAGFGGEGYAVELREAKEKLNVKYFGEKDWYDYCIKWWGVKWDVGGVEAYIERENDNTLTLCFYSAWCAPVAAYKRLEELGFTVDAKYHEPGMQFCGRYVNGYDRTYEIGGNSEWVKENIPAEIDDAFLMSEKMAEDEEREAENEDEDDETREGE